VQLECSEIGKRMPRQQKQLLAGKAMRSAWKLRVYKQTEINTKYLEKRQRPILDISHQHELTPVSIYRAILAQRVLDAHPHLSSLDKLLHGVSYNHF